MPKYPVGSIIIRTVTQPYAVFAILLVPLIVLIIYAAIRSGIPDNLWAALLPVLLLFGVYYNLYSITLVLTDDKIVYAEQWRSVEITLNEIRAIEPAPKLFGVQLKWAIYRVGSANPLLVHIGNFNRLKLKVFLKAVKERASHVDIAASLL